MLAGKSVISLGTFSGGRPFHIGTLLSDLCVPLGLVMPDTIPFLVEADRELNAETVPYINDQKFDDLFFRISFKPQKKNKTRKKRS
jgi:hypothetical protein